MWWKALAAAFGLTLIAELGDKTQIVILALSAKYGFRQVFLGAAAAFALLNALAVSVGAILYDFVPQTAIKYSVSAIFVIFGVLMLLPQREKKEGKDEIKERRGPFLTAFLLICLMELGDKTQLSLLALTAKYSYPLLIFLGGTLALWTTSLIAALIGEGLGRVIPMRWIRRLSGLIFIAFGIINLFW